MSPGSTPTQGHEHTWVYHTANERIRSCECGQWEVLEDLNKSWSVYQRGTPMIEMKDPVVDDHQWVYNNTTPSRTCKRCGSSQAWLGIGTGYTPEAPQCGLPITERIKAALMRTVTWPQQRIDVPERLQDAYKGINDATNKILSDEPCAHTWNYFGNAGGERTCLTCDLYEVRVVLPGGRIGWVDIHKVANVSKGEHMHEWDEWIYGVRSDTYWRVCKTCRKTETSDTKPVD